VGEQEAQAAERITAAKRALLPLRRELAAAMSQLQQIKGAMGFVPKAKGAECECPDRCVASWYART